MSLDHKNVVRNNDEFFCTVCGKSWDATDRDPPACVDFYSGGEILQAQEVDITILGEGHTETTTAIMTATGRSVIERERRFHAAALASARFGAAGLVAHALVQQAVRDAFSRGSRAIPQDILDNYRKKLQEQAECPGKLRIEDFSRLEELALASVNNGWPTPTSPLSAWLVHDLEDPKTSLLVFAMNGPSAVKYIAAITKKPGTLEARRCRSLDDEAFGASPYCDANPTNRNKAEKAARTRVISLLEWLQGV